MWNLHGVQLILKLLLLFVFAASIARGQSKTTDTIINHSIHLSDTLKKTEIYSSLKERASKRGWTRELYNLVFKTPSSDLPQDKAGSLDSAFTPYQDKIIRKIKIIVLPPFGISFQKMDTVNTNWFERAGNSIHTKTRQYIVSRNLFFKEGKPINDRVFAETEAFLRSTDFINDSRIIVIPIPTTDSADVIVVTHDVFSKGFNVRSLTPVSTDFEIYDRNVAGTGSSVSFRLIYNNTLHYNYGFGIEQSYQNIFRSFINLRMGYLNDIRTRGYYVNAERRLQIHMKFFGQIGYRRTINSERIHYWDSISPTEFDEVSFHIGRATAPDNSGKRYTTSLFFRDRNPSYKNVPTPEVIDFAAVRTQEYLLQLSVFNQHFYREYLIQNYNTTENIAYGYNVTAQFGYVRWKDFHSGFYTSLGARRGKRYSFGNFFAETSIGTHVNGSGAYQGIINLNLSYFTPLLHSFGKNRLRQFVDIDYTKVISPYQNITSYLFFSQLSSMNTTRYNFYARGNERFMITTETNFFTRLSTFGFRYLFYTFFDAGWVGNENLFSKKNLFTGVGLGTRIRNEHLVFSTINIQIGWYPRFSQIEFHSSGSNSPKTNRIFVPDQPGILQRH